MRRVASRLRRTTSRRPWNIVLFFTIVLAGGCPSIPPEWQDNPCLGSRECRIEGRCMAVDSTCEWGTTGNVTDCETRRGSGMISPCQTYGWCTPRDGWCQATRDADCAKTSFCTRSGRCVARDGQCDWPVSNDADCKRAYGSREVSPCTSYGRCEYRDGRCVAGSIFACLDQKWCDDYGQCTPIKGMCRTGSLLDCQLATRCWEQGECTHRGEGCAVVSDLDCRRSQACWNDDRCHAQDGACVRSP